MAARDDLPYLLRAPSAAAPTGRLPSDRAALLEFSPRLLPKLPIESSFILHAADIDAEIVLVSKELPEPRPALPGAVVLDGLELAALVTGVESDRFLAADLRRLCQTKLADPAHRLGLEDALAGAQPVGGPLAFGALLVRLEVSLVGVELTPFCDLPSRVAA